LPAARSQRPLLATKPNGDSPYRLRTKSTLTLAAFTALRRNALKEEIELLPRWRPCRFAFNQGWSIIATFAGIWIGANLPDNAVENRTPLFGIKAPIFRGSRIAA
jgi:hypothetical protein